MTSVDNLGLEQRNTAHQLYFWEVTLDYMLSHVDLAIIQNNNVSSIIYAFTMNFSMTFDKNFENGG